MNENLFFSPKTDTFTPSFVFFFIKLDYLNENEPFFII
jgi:hypothetical protein